MTPHNRRVDTSAAVVPQQLPPMLEARRKHVVQKFVDWTLLNPNATRLNSRQLAPDNVDEGIGVSRKTLGKWFPERQCHDSAWHALCFAALDYYELYDPPSSAPQHIRHCATTYRGWRREAEASGHTGPTDLNAMADPDLRSIVNGSQDLLKVTSAAKIFVRRQHEGLLKGKSIFEATTERWTSALKAADVIIDIAEDVLNRVEAAGSNIDTEVRRNCVGIIDAAVDAHRLKSRDPQRETSEIGLILNLRNMDLAITSSIRPKPDVALSHYQRDTARALLSVVRDQVLEKQLKASEVVVKALVDMRTEVWGDEARASTARRPEHVTAEKLIPLVSHLACFLFAYSPDHPMHTRARHSCDELLKLYGRAAHNEYRDVRALFNAAGRPDFSVAEPIEALRIVKFSGVGEVIIAKVLRRIATYNHTTAKDEVAPRHIDLYLGGPTVDEARRTLALTRARGLNDRAIAWLRTYGVADVVRDIAISERHRLDEILADRKRHSEEMFCAAIPAPIATSQERPARLRSRDSDAIVARIHDLTANLETTIVDGLLHADLNSWREVTNREDMESSPIAGAVSLLRLMDEVWRYLRNPELGLRTDLPPMVGSGVL